jgi:two-component system, NarL family, response regulator NreC
VGEPIRLVLADDHRAVRRSMRLLLESELDVHVIAEAEDVVTAVRHVTTHKPHVLLLDLRMPNGSSVEVIRRVRHEAPATEIVIATMDDSPQFARQAIDAGAIGFVIKDSADTELAAAIRCAARGEEYISPRVKAQLDALRRGVDVDDLSPREVEVLRLIALGLTSGEISHRLHLSRRTVEAHRRRIHRKLGLGKRSQLVSYALTHHLISEPPAA